MVENSSKQEMKKASKARRLVSLTLLIDFLIAAGIGVMLKIGVQDMYSLKLHVLSGFIMIPLTLAHIILEMGK